VLSSYQDIFRYIKIRFDTHTIPVQHGAITEELKSFTDTASANELPDVEKGLAQVEGKVMCQSNSVKPYLTNENFKIFF
jgi:hypothetical protein